MNTPNINQHLQKLQTAKCSLILRTKSELLARKVIHAAIKAGFEFIEITLTIPNALNIITDFATQYPQITFGAGTVLTLNQAQMALKHQAKYLVSPVYSPEILAWAKAHDVLYVPGGMTVNEIYQMHVAGAALIKFYPAMFTSPQFLSVIKNPLPDINCFVTGNVNLDNISAYFAAGAFAVGITDKIGAPDPNATDEELEQLASAYLKAVAVANSRK